MDDSKESIDEMLKAIEKLANTGDTSDDAGITGRRLTGDEGEKLIENGYTNIYPIWHTVVAIRDKALAYTIGAVWIPRELLEVDDPTHLQNEEGRYMCVLSSRQWFDEDKLNQEEAHTIYTAIDIVIQVMRAIEETVMERLDDDELEIVVTSLSITSDSLSKQLKRLKGGRRAEKQAQYLICDRALAKHKAEKMARITGPQERTET